MSPETSSAKDLLAGSGLDLSAETCTLETALNALNHIKSRFPMVDVELPYELIRTEGISPAGKLFFQALEKHLGIKDVKNMTPEERGRFTAACMDDNLSPNIVSAVCASPPPSVENLRARFQGEWAQRRLELELAHTTLSVRGLVEVIFRKFHGTHLVGTIIPVPVEEGGMTDEEYRTVGKIRDELLALLKEEMGSTIEPFQVKTIQLEPPPERQ